MIVLLSNGSAKTASLIIVSDSAAPESGEKITSREEPGGSVAGSKPTVDGKGNWFWTVPDANEVPVNVAKNGGVPVAFEKWTPQRTPFVWFAERLCISRRTDTI